MVFSRNEKFAPLSGVLSILFFIAASGLLGVYDYLPSADLLLEAFSGNPSKTIAVGYLGLFAAAFMLWFAGSVYSFLKAYEGDKPRLTMIAFSGCVASAVVFGLGFNTIIAIGSRAGATGGLSAAGAITLYDFYGTLLGQMGAFTFAVFIGATGVLSLRSDVFPKWFGWASVLIAIGLVTPAGYLVLLFALAWVVSVSVVIFRRGRLSTGMV